MPSEIYEVVAQAARYWFLFLMALIAWRSYRWLMRDRKQRKRRLRLLPDAGFVGELVVVKGNRELPAGLALPVSKEGVLGSIRGDDVYVPVAGVAKRHLWYAFDEDRGLFVEPYGRCEVTVDGQPLQGKRKRVYMTHGARLFVGDAELRLRMFAGFEQAGVAIARAAAFDDVQEEPSGAADAAAIQPDPAQQAQWIAALQQMQAFTPAQMVLLGQMGLLSPQGAPLVTPMQLQAMLLAGTLSPHQAAAFAQAAQSTPAQWAAMQTGANALAQAEQGKAEPLLDTGSGVFMPPPKAGAGGTILPQTAPEAAADEPSREQVPQAPLRYRANPLPPVREQGDEPGDEPDERFIPDDAFDEPPFSIDAETMLAADALWDRAQHGEQTQNTQDEGRYAPAPGEQAHAENGSFAPHVTFYPPVPDGMPEEEPLPEGYDPAVAAETWPYAPYPARDAHFGDGQYAEPDMLAMHEEIPPIEDVDEPYEYADEDEAPRSLYVEPDEAEKAKRILWDRYLKGGRER